MRFSQLPSLRQFLLFCLIMLLSMTSQPALAQFSGEDLSTVVVDDIPQAQLEAYYERFKRSGLSEDQALQLLRQRRLPESEIAKLQQRLRSIGSAPRRTGPLPTNNRPTTNNAQETVNSTSAGFLLDSAEAEIFGSEIFSQPSLSFQPDVQIATPTNYVLGANDEVQINVYGLSEANYQLTVTKDGYITIPGAGNIAVAGLSVEAARQKITSRLATTIYTAIRSGQTKVDISLGNLRSIRVTVVGQARKPGVFLVSAASSVFNVLYNAGGPNRNGSYRNIAVVRGGQVRQTVDLYDFLANGSLAANIRLQENDVIRIPFYQNRIRLRGEFKRPGIFELASGEGLQQMIAYAGGFTDSAYRNRLTIVQVTDQERQLKTITTQEFASYRPNPGDEVLANRLLSRFANRVTVEGGFNRPGDYELRPGLTIKQLFLEADGLRPDAYGDRISLSRLNADQSRSVQTFSSSQVINGSEGGFALQKEDRLFVPVVTDLRDEPTIQIQGEVRRPGTYPYRQGNTVQDLITQAGGFTEAATGKNIEIGRRITAADSGRNSLRVAEVISVDVEKDLGKSRGQLALQPFDILIVRNNPGYFEQKTVRIEGEVGYSGLFTIANREERISDLIARAGGFTALADPRSVSLRRRNVLGNDSLKLLAVSKQLNSVRRSNANLDADEIRDSLRRDEYDQVAINLEEIMRRPKSSIDIILQDGDVLNVPKRDQAVKVRGEVLLPTQVAFEEGRNLKYYVNRAGGFTSNARKRQSFAVSANGNGKTVRRFLFLKSYPIIEAGDDIYVPARPERRSDGMSATTVVGLASALASLAGVVIAIINISR